MRELAHRAAHPDELVEDQIRCRGAGRKRLAEKDPQLLAALEELVDPAPVGIRNLRCAGRARVPQNWLKS